jgi:hypothetical protein
MVDELAVLRRTSAIHARPIARPISLPRHDSKLTRQKSHNDPFPVQPPLYSGGLDATLILGERENRCMLERTKEFFHNEMPPPAEFAACRGCESERSQIIEKLADHDENVGRPDPVGTP